MESVAECTSGYNITYMYNYTCNIRYVLGAKRGFGPSADFVVQSLDACLAQKSEDCTQNAHINL